MISDNKKELLETDKLFKKLIAPSLRSFRLDSHVHQHYGPLKIDPVLLPFRSSNGHGTLQASKTSHSVTRSVRTPPATEIMFDDSFPKIGGQASSSAVEFGDSFAYSYAASGLRGQQHRIDTSLSSASCSASVPWTFYSTTKMKQLPLPQVQSSDVLVSTSSNPRGKKNVSVCSDRYLGTSRVGQQHLHRRSRSAADVLHPMYGNASSSDQVQRFEEEQIALLKTKSLRKSTEVMTHRKDRKYHMCGSGLPLFNRYLVDSEEMDRLRQLTKARSTKRGSSPVSYYGGYGGRINSGHSTRQKKMSSPAQEQKDDTQGNYTSQITTETNENEADVAAATPIATNDNDSLEGKVTQVEDDEREDQPKCADTTDPLNKEDLEVCNDDSPDAPQSIEGTVPSPDDDDVIQSSELEPLQTDDAQRGEQKDAAEGERSGPGVDDAEVETDEEPAGQENAEETGESKEVENMMPNVKISRTLKKKTGNGKDAFLTELINPGVGDADIEDMFGNFKEGTSSTTNAPQAVDSALGSNSQDGTAPMTAEEALTKMLISDDQIAAMEDDLKKINLLKGGMEKVGHLEESRLDPEEFKTDSETPDYGEEVFGKVRSDEELKEIERRREMKREERRAKSAKKAEETIASSAKVSEAKSKMAEIYNFISSRQQEVFEKKFEDFDVDGNGVITLQELFSRMYKGKDKDTGRAFMQVFDLNKDKTIEQREFVIVAALNDKLTGKMTESLDAPLELDLEMLARHITAYKELFEVTDQDADGRLTLEDIMLSIALSGSIESGSDPEIVRHVHNTIDADDNGTIDFMEFLTYIPFFLKLHKRMVQGRHITIAEVETARQAVKEAVLQLKSSGDVTMMAF